MRLYTTLHQYYTRPISLLFLVYTDAYHLLLHSFPTRRSSDLARLGRMMDKMPNIYPEVAAVLYDIGRQPRAAHDFFIKYRSEEHTSELQSHSDLVCRLLLEKKKRPGISLYLH